MINNQVGGNILEHKQDLDDPGDLDIMDDMDSIFINLEEDNIIKLNNFINNNDILLEQFNKKNIDSIEYLRDTQFLIINNPDNFNESIPNLTSLTKPEDLKYKLEDKYKSVSNIGFSTINPDDDDDTIDNLLVDQIRLFGRTNDPSFMKISREIKRHQKLKINTQEQIAKKQLIKMLQLEKNNRYYETKSKNIQLSQHKKFVIKQRAIYAFAGLITIGAGIIMLPYILGPTGLINSLELFFQNNLSDYINPDIIGKLGGDVNGEPSYELAKIIQTLVKDSKMQIIFSTYTILSAGAESKGGIKDHISMMIDAAKEESKSIIK